MLMVFYCCSICYITLYTNIDTEPQKLAKEVAKRVRLFLEEIEKMYRIVKQGVEQGSAHLIFFTFLPNPINFQTKNNRIGSEALDRIGSYKNWIGSGSDRSTFEKIGSDRDRIGHLLKRLDPIPIRSNCADPWGGDDISEQVLKSENPWSILHALLYLYF
jgi:hypothetical protein